MIKVFCDRCEKELKHGRNVFRYSYHLDPKTGFGGHAYIDFDNDKAIVQVSGREIEKDVCNTCYNEVMGVAVAKFFERKDGQPHPTADEILKKR